MGFQIQRPDQLQVPGAHLNGQSEELTQINSQLDRREQDPPAPHNAEPAQLARGSVYAGVQNDTSIPVGTTCRSGETESIGHVWLWRSTGPSAATNSACN